MSYHRKKMFITRFIKCNVQSNLNHLVEKGRFSLYNVFDILTTEIVVFHQNSSNLDQFIDYFLCKCLSFLLNGINFLSSNEAVLNLKYLNFNFDDIGTPFGYHVECYIFHPKNFLSVPKNCDSPKKSSSAT